MKINGLFLCLNKNGIDGTAGGNRFDYANL